MSADTMTPPAGGDVDRGSTLIALSWTWASVSLLFVALRFYSRIKYASILWWDDWWILFTLILTLAFTALWTTYALAGGCRHVYYLTEVQVYALTKWNWISQPFCVMAIASGKVSVAFLILRLQSPCVWRTYLVYFFAITAFAVGAVDSVITFAQCSPAYALWTPNVKAECWSSDVLTYFAMSISAYYAFLDLALAVVPITMIWQLQMKWRKKTGVCLMLSTGVFAAICGVIKTTKLPELGLRNDTTWNTEPLFLWNANEINVIIIAACIPSLRQIMANVIDRNRTSSLHPPSRTAPYRVDSKSTDRTLHSTRASHVNPAARYGWPEPATTYAWPDKDSESDNETLRDRPGIVRTVSVDVESQYHEDCTRRWHEGQGFLDEFGRKVLFGDVGVAC